MLPSGRSAYPSGLSIALAHARSCHAVALLAIASI
jgi:hypothetical protein